MDWCAGNPVPHLHFLRDSHHLENIPWINLSIKSLLVLPTAWAQ